MVECDWKLYTLTDWPANGFSGLAKLASRKIGMLIHVLESDTCDLPWMRPSSASTATCRRISLQVVTVIKLELKYFGRQGLKWSVKNADGPFYTMSFAPHRDLTSIYHVDLALSPILCVIDLVPWRKLFFSCCHSFSMMIIWNRFGKKHRFYWNQQPLNEKIGMYYKT